jgi:NifU-like protein involved in Fe-S cluster formation
MTVILTVEGDIIVEGRFQTYQCPAANVAGNFLAMWVEGKTLEQAAAFTPETLTMGVGPMPLGREHVVGLVCGSLKSALANLAKLEADTEEATR